MKKTKAIILAGGSGTRLYPMSLIINKHLLPIYSKPMIYYSLSLAMLANVRDVLIIVNKEDLEMYKKLLQDGSHLGIKISYAIQEKPKGLAEGLLIAKDFIKDSTILYILADNIFFGHDLPKIIQDAILEVDKHSGCYIFGYNVKDPQRFGVIEFNKNFQVVKLEEKPKKPKSNWAITGIYVFDSNATKYASIIKPSSRGELEITSVLDLYLKHKKLKVKLLGRGFAWFDAGTYESFLEAINFVSTMERKTGLMIGCPEEIAFSKGWISKQQVLSLAKLLNKTDYGKYLLHLAKE
jgi:glucose-1-phosphate thymidylyltransferase